MAFPNDPSVLTLALVKDAHNQGAIVQPFDDPLTHTALYDAALQKGGVVIRPCHLVVVDRSREPWEIVWRIGTRGTIRTNDGQTLTLDVGHRVLTIPLQDDRPENERATPLALGTEVLLRGHIEQATVQDTFSAGKLAHPERLQAHLDAIIDRHR